MFGKLIGEFNSISSLSE